MIHVGIIFGSILDHFGVILVHLGALWATLDPLGTPWEERDDLGSPFGAFWCHFWTPWGPLGRPLGTPREQEGAQRPSQEGSREGSKTRPQKLTILDPPGEAQVSSRQGESIVFTISPGSLLDPILAPFWHPFGTPGGHYSHQEGRWRGWLAG